MIEIRKYIVRVLIFFTGFAVVGFIGYIDRITGHETSLSVLYLIPVLITTFLIGRVAGAALAAVSGLAWTMADLFMGSGLLSDANFYWNAACNTAIFEAFVFMSYKLKCAYQREKELARRDFVTGVANIKAFFEMGKKEIKSTTDSKSPITIV